MSKNINFHRIVKIAANDPFGDPKVHQGDFGPDEAAGEEGEGFVPYTPGNPKKDRKGPSGPPVSPKDYQLKQKSQKAEPEKEDSGSKPPGLVENPNPKGRKQWVTPEYAEQFYAEQGGKPKSEEQEGEIQDTVEEEAPAEKKEPSPEKIVEKSKQPTQEPKEKSPADKFNEKIKNDFYDALDSDFGRGLDVEDKNIASNAFDELYYLAHEEGLDPKDSKRMRDALGRIKSVAERGSTPSGLHPVYDAARKMLDQIKGEKEPSSEKPSPEKIVEKSKQPEQKDKSKTLDGFFGDVFGDDYKEYVNRFPDSSKRIEDAYEQLKLPPDERSKPFYADQYGNSLLLSEIQDAARNFGPDGNELYNKIKNEFSKEGKQIPLDEDSEFKNKSDSSLQSEYEAIVRSREKSFGRQRVSKRERKLLGEIKRRQSEKDSDTVLQDKVKHFENKLSDNPKLSDTEKAYYEAIVEQGKKELEKRKLSPSPEKIVEKSKQPAPEPKPLPKPRDPEAHYNKIKSDKFGPGKPLEPKWKDKLKQVGRGGRVFEKNPDFKKSKESLKEKYPEFAPHFDELQDAKESINLAVKNKDQWSAREIYRHMNEIQKEIFPVVGKLRSEGKEEEAAELNKYLRYTVGQSGNAASGNFAKSKWKWENTSPWG